jgi:hypothetical protein
MKPGLGRKIVGSVAIVAPINPFLAGKNLDGIIMLATGALLILWGMRTKP